MAKYDHKEARRYVIGRRHPRQLREEQRNHLVDLMRTVATALRGANMHAQVHDRQLHIAGEGYPHAAAVTIGIEGFDTLVVRNLSHRPVPELVPLQLHWLEPDARFDEDSPRRVVEWALDVLEALEQALGVRKAG